MPAWLTDRALRASGLAFPGAARRVTRAAVESTLRPGETLTWTTPAGCRDRVAVVTRAGTGRVTLFLYGNAMVLAVTAPIRGVLGSAGAGVVCVDYAGYGLSEGVPGEGGCYRAAHVGLAHAEALGPGPGGVDVVGWSLGSAVALELASTRAVSSLVLLSPMSGVAAFALAPVGLQGTALRRFGPFAGARRAASVGCPVLLVSGEADRVTPPWMARDLAVALGRRAGATTELVMVPRAGHNDLFAHPETWQRVLAFVGHVTDLPADP